MRKIIHKWGKEGLIDVVNNTFKFYKGKTPTKTLWNNKYFFLGSTLGTMGTSTLLGTGLVSLSEIVKEGDLNLSKNKLIALGCGAGLKVTGMILYGSFWNHNKTLAELKEEILKNPKKTTLDIIKNNFIKGIIHHQPYKIAVLGNISSEIIGNFQKRTNKFKKIIGLTTLFFMFPTEAAPQGITETYSRGKKSITIETIVKDEEIIVNSNLKISGIGYRINEGYSATIDKKTLNTTYYSNTKTNNSIFGTYIANRNFTYEDSMIICSNRLTKKTQSYKINKSNEKENKEIRITSPATLLYIIEHSKKGDLEKTKTIGSDGKRIWEYTFTSENEGRGYWIHAKGSIKNTNFSCFLEDNEIKLIQYERNRNKINLQKEKTKYSTQINN